MARTRLFHDLSRLTAEAFQQPMTRRAFLKRGSALAASAALWPLLETRYTARADETTLPVVIVGAGLGGLVTAYALSRRGIPCEIYEASARVGGRAYTHRNFNAEGMFCELGGELVDSNHEELIALCAELNLPLERFEPADQGLEPEIFYSEGKQYRAAEVVEASRPLAQALERDIRLCFPTGEIELPTCRNPYNAAWLDRMSLAEYLDQRTELASWLKKLIKAAYTGEYGLDADEQSALNLLLLIKIDPGSFRMFGDSDEALRVQGGSGRVPEALAEALRATVPIHTGHVLRRIRLDADRRITLDFRHASRNVTLSAQQVVMAAPFSVLRGIPGALDLPLSSLKKKCIRELGYGANSKQMIGFRSRFWRQPQGDVPANTGALYTDWSSQCFWETSRLQPGTAGILTNFLGGDTGKRAVSGQHYHALKQLTTLYPDAQSEFDGRTALFNWHRYPWAQGSYSCPRPGQYTTLLGVAHEPELENRLFFAGEHCSVDWLGFMNGAVQSGLTAAAQVAETMTKASLPALTV